MNSSSDEDAYRNFKDALEADLHENSKPVIFALSMLAEDYKRNSEAIARSIDDYVREIPSNIKILGLYLMDSIMKNHKYTTNYNEIFETRILELFTHVFESVGEQNRKALFKLRGTWNEFFTNRVLYDLDVRIKRIDTAWPITASGQAQADNIINPNILTSQAARSRLAAAAATAAAAAAAAAAAVVVNIETPRHSDEIDETTPLFSTIKLSKKIEAKTKLNNDAKTSSSLSSSSNVALVRDPRIRKNKSSQSLQTTTTTDQVSLVELNNFEATTPSKSIKSKQISTTSLKRTSPNNLNPNEMKKVKLTNPLSNQLSSSITTNTANSIITNQSPSNIKLSKLPSPNKSKITQLNSIQTKTVSYVNSNTHKHQKINSLRQESDTKEEDKQVKQLVRVKASKQKNEIESSSSSLHSIKMSIINTNKTPSNPIPKINRSEEVKNINDNERIHIKKSTPSTIAVSIANNGSNSSPKKNLPSLLELDTKSHHHGKVLQATKSKVSNSNSKQSQQQVNAAAAAATAAAIKVTKQTNLNTVESIKSSQGQKKVLANSNSTNSTQISNENSSNAKVVTKNVINSNIEQRNINSQENNQIVQNQPNLSAFSNDVDERFVAGRDVDERTVNNSKSIIMKPTSNKEEIKSQQQQQQSTETKSDTSNSATDIIANLIGKVKPIVTTSDDNEKKNSYQKNLDTAITSDLPLSELERQLTISRQNDQNNGQASSTSTEKLLQTIRSILELTKKNLLAENKQTDTILSQDKVIENKNIEPLIEPISTPPAQQQQDVTYDLPPIKPRDINDNLNDSLLIIDGRSYRIQPKVVRVIRVYYHDHELFCDTRTKDVFIDKKRIYRMGEQTKEVVLNGRKVRLMYMGRRIEIWIDGISFHLRADSPPKQISITSSQSNQIKRYYVTVDSRTMDMYFNNYKVCQINQPLNTQGPQNQSNTLMCQLAPDDFEQHEISFVCPPKRIMIDGVPRTMRYDLAVPCIEMDNNKYFVIRFSGHPRDIYIDDIPYLVPFDRSVRIKLNGRAHELAWGGPGFEVIIDGRPYELQFNKQSREIIIGTRPHFIYICGEAPDVKICGELPYELQVPVSSNDQQFEGNQRNNNKQQNHLSEKKPRPLMTFEVPPPSVHAPIQANASNKLNSSSVNTSSPLTGSSIDVMDLVKKLTDQGFIKAPNKVTLPLGLADIVGGNNTKKNNTLINDIPDKQQHQQQQMEKIPDLTSFDTDLLKQKYTGAIQSLYSGVQCAACGNRFNQNDTMATSSGASRYSKHLDWHFRMNKKEKDEINKAHSRAWYYVLMEWIQYEELSEDAFQETEADSQITNTDNVQRSNDELETIRKTKKRSLVDGNDYSSDEAEHDDLLRNAEKNLLNELNVTPREKSLNSTTLSAFTSSNTCPATNDIDDSCYICKDPFEIFWNQDKEEWHFKDAVRVDMRVYHPICFEDARDDNNASFNQHRSPENDSILALSNNISPSIKKEPSANISTENLTDNSNNTLNDHNNTVEMSSILSESDENNSKNRSVHASLVSECYDENLKDEPKTP